ncbi:STAS domain-containing protein [Lentzea sp. E54]|uniref:STAS domain-containing protein n=1 Tax=Lentzea xerophila TaxID=3435883 RepID=UPI003DA57B49
MSDSSERPPLAQAEVSVEDGIVVVTLTGEVDLVNADELGSALRTRLEARPDGLVVDLALDFLGSPGLALLVKLDLDAARAGVPFGLVTSSRAARLPLELTGLTDTLPLFDSAPEAVKSLRRDG